MKKTVKVKSSKKKLKLYVVTLVNLCEESPSDVDLELKAFTDKKSALAHKKLLEDRVRANNEEVGYDPDDPYETSDYLYVNEVIIKETFIYI